LVLVIGAFAGAQDLSIPFCDAAIHEETTELRDARNAESLDQSTYAAYLKIFEMIKELRQTIPEMDYIKAKYNRDAAKLTLEKSNLIIERQSALVEQYQAACNKPALNKESGDRLNAIRQAYLRYRKADCDSLAKGIEIAANNLEYNREYLKKISKLHDDKFANNNQVILAELDVEHEEKNLADAKNRTAVCRAEMARLQSADKP
jgi:hypothetical protein